MPERSSKNRPRDLNQLAASIVGEATGENPPTVPESEKNPHAQALGRLGGKKGGPARAAMLTKEQRSEIAKKAARMRWKRNTDPEI
jgi:hypothetical protein